MPLHEGVTAFLTQMGEQGVKPIHESTPDEVRALTAGLAELYGEGPAMERVDNVTIRSTVGRSRPGSSSPRHCGACSSTTTAAGG